MPKKSGTQYARGEGGVTLSIVFARFVRDVKANFIELNMLK